MRRWCGCSRGCNLHIYTQRKVRQTECINQLTASILACNEGGNLDCICGTPPIPAAPLIPIGPIGIPPRPAPPPSGIPAGLPATPGRGTAGAEAVLLGGAGLGSELAGEGVALAGVGGVASSVRGSTPEVGGGVGSLLGGLVGCVPFVLVEAVGSSECSAGGEGEGERGGLVGSAIVRGARVGGDDMADEVGLGLDVGV
jgi:hypothetical protein